MPHPKADAFITRQPTWQAELRALRSVLLEASLDEDLKWGKPCYGKNAKNIAILQPMKDHVALMFFQGALLRDPAGILEAPGPNSHAARRACFRDVAAIEAARTTLRTYLDEAIEVATTGGKPAARAEHAFTPELVARLAADAVFRAAFEALTPGRRREYDLFVAGAKQPATRERRIAGFMDRVLRGKGLRDV